MYPSSEARDASADEPDQGTAMATHLDAFDRVVCINLDERTDRWEQMQDTVAPLLGRATLERFSAVKPNLAKAAVHNGRAGCLLSHRRVIEDALRDGLDSVLVFEDDVHFAPACDHRLNTTLQTLHTTPWSVFYLGFTPKAPLLPAGPGLVQTFGGTTTHAIAYHRRGMPQMLQRLPDEADVLRFLSRYKSLDRFYWQHLAPALPCYAANPLIAFQRDDFSDIQQQALPSNEAESTDAFARQLRPADTRAARLRIGLSLGVNRVCYRTDALRRAWSRSVEPA
ncbi:MAG: glycosyltransferase family 25 protein [Planctomycetota bacterium]